MNSQQHIDDRAMVLAQRIIDRIEADPQKRGLARARKVCRRWQASLDKQGQVNANEWAEILERPWTEIRSLMLSPDENAKRLRQNSPFCGILSNRERWQIIKEFSKRDARAA